ncbi:MAG: hypothetical protein O7G83_20060, partial [Proteobacteria bacterium]|nr:hypothetical protein [Pseudomonadota bacterium]
MTSPKAVAIVTGSDTVSAAIGSMESLLQNLPSWCDIIQLYSTAPPCVTERVRAVAGARSVMIVQSDKWNRQNVARNEALTSLPAYDYYLFLDLDSRIGPGCLERFIETHGRTGAALVGGIIYYGDNIDFGRKGEKVIHFAGGDSNFRPDADGRPGFERVHLWEGRRMDEMRDEIGDEPWDSELIELHAVCLTRQAVEALAPFDPKMLAMENVDISLQARNMGFRQVMDP